MWNGQNRSVIFTMLGSVQGCHIVEPTTLGLHICRAITIIPYGDAWRKFQTFLGDLYGHGRMRGPFDYGCLLTLSGRREGYSTPGLLSSSSSLYSRYFLIFHACSPNLDLFGTSTPVTPKKNSRAFGSSGAAAGSSEWYDAKLQNCIDFDKPSTCPFFNNNYVNTRIFLSPYLRRFKETFPLWSRRFRRNALPSFVQEIRENCGPPC
jgi:hypothetical protein